MPSQALRSFRLLVLSAALFATQVATAAVVPVGEETVLSTVPGGLQPKDVARAAGRFAVVHEADAEGDFNKIVLRYLDPLSNTASDPVEVAASGAYPQVAAFADGSLVVAWTDYYTWFVRFFDAAGSPTTDALPVVTVVAAYARVAAGTEGHWALVFNRYIEESHSWEIVGLRFQGTTQLSEEPFVINETGWETIVAMNAANEFVASWTESHEYEECDDCGEFCCFDPSYTHVLGRGYDSDATPDGDAQFLGSDFHDDEQGQSGHALALRDGGGFVGAWLDYIESDYEPPGYLVMRLLDETGSPAAKSRVLAEVEREASALTLAVTSGQAVLAVMQQHYDEAEIHENYDIELYSTTVGDGPVEKLAIETPDSPYDFTPVLASDNDGALLLVWERQVGQTPVRQIMAQPFFAAASITCGDANYDGALSATDALGTLRVAVGTRYCALAVCDSNGDGQTTASDASVTLRAAVGIEASTACPATGTDVPAPFDDPWW